MGGKCMFLNVCLIFRLCLDREGARQRIAVRKITKTQDEAPRKLQRHVPVKR